MFRLLIQLGVAFVVFQALGKLRTDVDAIKAQLPVPKVQ